jgi:hypothetical protein
VGVIPLSAYQFDTSKTGFFATTASRDHASLSKCPGDSSARFRPALAVQALPAYLALKNFIEILLSIDARVVVQQ